ncbi:MAG: hypothetical protein ABI042_07000 [Verrucomicrobiota bacterium]
MKIIFLKPLLLLLFTISAVAGEYPYDELSVGMKPFKGVKKAGKTYVPFCLMLRDEKARENIDLANFRLLTQSKEEFKLEIEKFSDLPKDQLTEMEKDLKKEGYTHRIWIPKDGAKFKGGSLVNSLPKGTVTIQCGIHISDTFDEK